MSAKDAKVVNRNAPAKAALARPLIAEQRPAEYGGRIVSALRRQLEKRAEHGREILQSLTAKSAEEFGRRYGARNLANMVPFAEVFPDLKIVQAAPAQLTVERRPTNHS